MSQYFINAKYESAERFDTAIFLEQAEDGFDALNSRFLLDLENLKSKGRYTVQSEEGRPDLLSFRIYGSTQYWWILMYFNRVAKSDNIVAGMNIDYPSIDDLENLYFSLRAKQAALT